MSGEKENKLKDGGDGAVEGGADCQSDKEGLAGKVAIDKDLKEREAFR